MNGRLLDRDWRLRSRGGLTLMLSAAALLLALVGAVGPAKRLTATYAWPPRQLPPSAQPMKLWYSPLLLTRTVAGSMHVTIPCRGLSPPLDRAAAQPLLLATTRHAARFPGLRFVKAQTRLLVQFGDVTLVKAPLDVASAKCSAITFDVHGDTWSLRTATGQVKTGDFGGATPLVTGLFSDLDLRRGAQPQIAVTTYPYGAHASWWQWPAWLLAIVLACGALVAAFGARSRRGTLATARSRLVGHLGVVDGVVALVLLAWWMVGPVLYDDGWVKVRQTNGLNGDGFSNYYSTYGTNLPLDLWSEWLQHWVVAHSANLLILRLPALALLGGTWILSRLALARLLGATRSRAAEWALAAAFLLNATAWDVTLRPEPFVAFLLMSVFCLALRFAHQPSGGTLAVAGILAALSVTAHPAGLIALAPLLAVSPRIISWVRGTGWRAPTVAVSAVVTTLLVVVTVGSDAHQRASEAHFVRANGDATADWRTELLRYGFLGAEPTVLRRASVSLMLAALLAWIVRRRNSSNLDIAGTTLTLALFLLIPTPSKWSWHFGALAGLAAITVAAEIARLRGDRQRLGWPLRALVAYGVSILVVTWALGQRTDWSTEFGLRTLSWTMGFERRITLPRLVIVLSILLLATVLLVALIRGGRAGVWRAPWALVPWLVPLIVFPLLLWNVGMFVADAHKTPAWTLARQNVESVSGSAGCGLADETLVADPASMHAIDPTGAAVPRSLPPWLARAASPTPAVYALFARGERTRLTLPWFTTPRDRRIGFYFLNGIGAGDGFAARWRMTGDATTQWAAVGGGTSNISPVESNVDEWTFVPQGALPRRPRDASAVQFLMASAAQPPHALTATGAVAYRTTTLASLFRRDGRPLLTPNLVLYMPCAKAPRLAKGVVDVPSVIVAHSGLWPLQTIEGLSPGTFINLLDLYSLRDLGIADSKVAPTGMIVLWVNRHIPGAALAPAVESG